jgi:hypothetical protein
MAANDPSTPERFEHTTPDSGGFQSTISRRYWLGFAAAMLLLAPGADSSETRAASDTFMVIDRGTAPGVTA